MNLSHWILLYPLLCSIESNFLHLRQYQRLAMNLDAMKQAYLIDDFQQIFKIRLVFLRCFEVIFCLKRDAL